MPNTKTRQRDSADPLDVRYMAQGQLFRAIVSLPQHLCPHSEPLHERVVFFDAPTRSHAVQRLVSLLDAAWSVESETWFDDGLAYNLQSAHDLVGEGLSAALDARLFEISWGGPEAIGYAQPGRVDLFLAPVLKARLLAILDTLPQAGAAA